LINKVLLVAATNIEILATINYLETNFNQKSFTEFSNDKLTITPFIMGVGIMQSAFALGRHRKIQDFDLLIHAGISGTYSGSKLNLGDTVEVHEEQFGDIGAEDRDGKILELFDLELLGDNQFPFQNRKLINNSKKYRTKLKQVTGNTVSKASGELNTINQMEMRKADVESMEGASVFYACRNIDIPFVSIRGISNNVEPRNKSNWNINLALDNLNQEIIKILGELSEK
jgi:futalosine hydrolase